MDKKKELRRLGNRRFLVIVFQSVLDGLTDYVNLMESFDDQHDAESYTENLKQSLLHKQLGWTASQDKWELESKNVIRTLPSPQSISFLRIFFERTYKIHGGAYNTCVYLYKSYWAV